MKKTITLLVFVLVLIAISAIGVISVQKNYKNGVFTGESRSRYTNEPYWGQATVEIKDDKVIKMTFQIIDKEKNEVFGPDYERHFKNNAEYIQQCRNDLKGIKAYTEKYMKTKDMEKIDAITGATWSYNLFKDALKAALDKAKNK